MFLEKLVLFILPKWKLNGTPYKNLWNVKETNELRKTARVTFFLSFIIYLAHFFAVDQNLPTSGNAFWFKYRFSLAGISLGLVFFVKWLKSAASINTVFLLFGSLATYLQSYSMTQSELVPYFWTFLLPCVVASVATIQLPLAFGFLTVSFLISWDNMISAGASHSLLLGSAITSLGILTVYKRALSDKVLNFIAQEELIMMEQKLVSAQKDLTSSILKVFPRKHKKLLLDLIATKKLTPVQAMDEILRQKKVDIACIFTDIRGFTESSKSLSNVENTIVPNINAITHLMEDAGGIPSFVGDLVFSYFDDEDYSSNVLSALEAATNALELQVAFNRNHADSPVHRYMILDCGKAVVGNIGGIDSSMEITALGKPANLAARIDEVTKDASVRAILGQTAIVLSPFFVEQLSGLLEIDSIRQIELEKQSLNVRDFPEVKIVYYLNEEDLSQSLQTAS